MIIIKRESNWMTMEINGKKLHKLRGFWSLGTFEIMHDWDEKKNETRNSSVRWQPLRYLELGMDSARSGIELNLTYLRAKPAPATEVSGIVFVTKQGTEKLETCTRQGLLKNLSFFETGSLQKLLNAELNWIISRLRPKSEPGIEGLYCLSNIARKRKARRWHSDLTHKTDECLLFPKIINFRSFLYRFSIRLHL